MKRKINLNYEMLIGLLQGKEIHLIEGEHHIVLAPPFDGVFLTRDQIDEIRYSSEERVFNIIQKVLEAREETHSFQHSVHPTASGGSDEDESSNVGGG